MTIEEAQDRILELTEQVTTLTNERDTLSANLADRDAELEDVRKLNQKYFNKLMAQNSEQDGDGDGSQDEPAPSCEEFAKTLNIF